MSKQYPIGEFDWPTEIDDAALTQWITEIEALPANVREAVRGLTDQQLDTPYREAGWTIRQVVHHLPDSHMNSYIRFKLALTEDNPTIRPYDEGAWAELADGKSGDPEPSIALLESLHVSWVAMLRDLTPDQLARTFVHPDWRAPVRIDQNIALYAWHGRHHLAHITTTRHEYGW